MQFQVTLSKPAYNAKKFMQPSFLYHVHCFFRNAIRQIAIFSISQQNSQQISFAPEGNFETKLKHKHQRIDFTFCRLVWILENDRKKIVLKCDVITQTERETTDEITSFF